MLPIVSRQTVGVKLIMKKTSVRWDGSKNRTRIMSTQSGVLERAGITPGILPGKDSDTDPAELIAAAHAGSFSLALSDELGPAGSISGSIVTTATVTLEHPAAGWTIMNIHLNVTAKLPGITQNEFIDATVRAKTRCLVSRLLRANISMNAKLEK